MATMNLGGFDDWQEGHCSRKTFDNLTDAETYYVEVWQNFLRIIHTSTQSLII